MAERRAVVMVLDSVFPKPGGGGAESQVATLGRRLVREGVGVRVVVPMLPWGPRIAEERIDGLRVSRLPYPRVPLLGGAVMLARLAATLVRSRARYGVIHAHIAHNMAAVSCVVGRLLGKPVIVKFTGMREMAAGGVLAARPGIAARLRRLALRGATAYQATSHELARLLRARGFDAGKVRLVPNAVDTRRFAPADRDDPDAAPLVGVFAGRLAPEKGLAQLLACWRRVLAPAHRARLVVVGDGPLEGELRALACELGLEDQVAFTGRSDRVEDRLAGAHFGVLPSLAEGLSNTLLEYMASGLPVIGSRVSGTEDLLVHGENGWLFEPGDDAGLEACLAAAAGTPRAALRAMGRAARERVVAHASIDAVVRRLIDLYGVAGAPPAGNAAVDPCAESPE